MSRQSFFEAPTFQRPCVRSFEIIGAATKKLPAQCGRLINEQIPSLRRQIDAILAID